MNMIVFVAPLIFGCLAIIASVDCWSRFQYKVRHTISAPRMSSSVQSNTLTATPSAQTKRIFDRVDQVESAGGAGGSSSLNGLINLDKAWDSLKNGAWQREPPRIVSMQKSTERILSDDADDDVYDIVVCGGTLGIFYATAMLKMGYKVAVIERGRILGRPQEWNISKKELNALIRLNVLDADDIERITGIEFNPVRVGFKSDTSPGSTKPGFEVYVNDILNLGIKPDVLIELTKQRFVDAGGLILEGASLTNIDVYADVAKVRYTSATAPASATSNFAGTAATTAPGTTTATAAAATELRQLNARLVIDAMGNGSPIAKQIRGSVEPDGICVVVGTCASGYDASNNTYSDVIYTDTPLTKKEQSQLQYFWEAFPAGSGPRDRTTYLFTYMDAKPERPSIMEIMDDYWSLLPRYQGVNIDELEVIRILYGMFPTYRASPIQSPFNRVLQVGDASGIQSPLSFGGFGSLTRHLQRVTSSLHEALQHELLDADDLRLINSYQPNLSACWMFQRAMSVPVGRDPQPELVIGTLSNSFSAMEKLGDATMRPFLQDVLQFGPLLRTLTIAAGQDLLTPFKIVPHVGVVPFVDFIRHFTAMGLFTLYSRLLGPLLTVVADRSGSTLSPRLRFKLRRWADTWKFGSGLDYYDHE